MKQLISSNFFLITVSTSKGKSLKDYYKKIRKLIKSFKWMSAHFICEDPYLSTRDFLTKFETN